MAHLMFITQMRHCFPLGRGRHHFLSSHPSAWRSSIVLGPMADKASLQHLFRQQLLQPAVLDFKRSQLLCIRWFHATIPTFVFVKRRLAYPVPPTDVRRPLASLLLLQYRNDLFVRKPLLHSSVLLLGGLYNVLEEF